MHADGGPWYRGPSLYWPGQTACPTLKMTGSSLLTGHLQAMRSDYVIQPPERMRWEAERGGDRPLCCLGQSLSKTFCRVCTFVHACINQVPINRTRPDFYQPPISPTLRHFGHIIKTPRLVKSPTFPSSLGWTR